MTYYIIYQIKNKINNKVYIGYHQTENLNDGYMGSGTYIRRAIKKHGIENFEKTILHFCETKEEMKKLETEIVNESFIARNDNYNLRVGGHGGVEKGFVSVLGTNKKVSKEEFDKNPEMHGVVKGKIAVFDKNGRTFQVDKDDERIKKGELTRAFEINGTVSCIDARTNKCVRVSKQEYSLHKNEYYSQISKNMAVVKDKNGKILRVSIFDERYLSGELVGHTKGVNMMQTEYVIFDSLGQEKYRIVNESFRIFCKKNNLPSVFKQSYLNNGAPIYQKLCSNKKRLEAKGLLKYIGWYAKKIK